MRLNELLKGLDVKEIKGDTLVDIASISDDSRRVTPGGLFVAIKGFKHEGIKFINEAVERGAVAVVMDCQDNITSLTCKDITYITIEDTRHALAVISCNFYGDPSNKIKVIGITGTNGKTTTAYLIDSILSTSYRKVSLLSTIEYRIDKKAVPSSLTTPDQITFQKYLKEMVDKGQEFCVMEVSSHALTLDRVYGTRFEAVVFTNLSREHLDFYNTMDEYFSSKLRLFNEYRFRYAVINTDNPWGRELIKRSRSSVSNTIVSYGIKEQADIMVVDIATDYKGLSFAVRLPDRRRLRITSYLIGVHNIYNILAAVSAAVSLDIPLQCIEAAIAGLSCISGRMERVDEGQDFSIFVDYAHTGDALEHAIRALKELGFKRVITVFGCGGDRDKGKRKEMGIVSTTWSDLSIVTSDNPRTEDPSAIINDITSGLSDKKRLLVIEDRTTAIETAIMQAEGGDAVLIAGKGHEDYQIIGDKRISFDDRVVARNALKKKRKV